LEVGLRLTVRVLSPPICDSLGESLKTSHLPPDPGLATRTELTCQYQEIWTSLSRPTRTIAEKLRPHDSNPSDCEFCALMFLATTRRAASKPRPIPHLADRRLHQAPSFQSNSSLEGELEPSRRHLNTRREVKRKVL